MGPKTLFELLGPLYYETLKVALIVPLKGTLFSLLRPTYYTPVQRTTETQAFTAPRQALENLCLGCSWKIRFSHTRFRFRV